MIDTALKGFGQSTFIEYKAQTTDCLSNPLPCPMNQPLRLICPQTTLSLVKMTSEQGVIRGNCDYASRKVTLQRDREHSVVTDQRHTGSSVLFLCTTSIQYEVVLECVTHLSRNSRDSPAYLHRMLVQSGSGVNMIDPTPYGASLSLLLDRKRVQLVS